MAILRSQNEITDFLMILVWACPFSSLNAEIFCVYKLWKPKVFFFNLKKSALSDLFVMCLQPL